MSAKQVARVLKKIKDECYKNDKKYPDYYAPFLDDPADFDIFELTTLFEMLEKRKNVDDCPYEKTLYEYLFHDKSELAKNSYTKKLQGFI